MYLFTLVAQISYLRINPSFFNYVRITSELMYSIYPLYTSSLSISILDSHNSFLLINTSNHSAAVPLFTPSIMLGLPSYHEVIRLTLNWMKFQYNLGFILLGNRIKLNYVVNWNYILTVSKTQQIQVNCLLDQIYEFK